MCVVYTHLLVHSLSKVSCSPLYFRIAAPDVGRWPDPFSVMRHLLLSSFSLTFIEYPARRRKHGNEFLHSLPSLMSVYSLLQAPYLSSSA